MLTPQCAAPLCSQKALLPRMGQTPSWLKSIILEVVSIGEPTNPKEDFIRDDPPSLSPPTPPQTADS
jgi:hypothetical protein